MEATKLSVNHDSSCSVDAAMGILFTKLDEAIDDIENGRVLTEDEFWEEIDKD